MAEYVDCVSSSNQDVEDFTDVKDFKDVNALDCGILDLFYTIGPNTNPTPNEYLPNQAMGDAQGVLSPLSL